MIEKKQISLKQESKSHLELRFCVFTTSFQILQNFIYLLIVQIY